MSRWFRFYDDAINDPKILKLSDKLYRVWVGILCVASKNDGKLPSLDDMALMIRMKPEKLGEAIKSLMISGLIDQDGPILSPHNWNARQFKSDVSTERVQRFRKQQRNVSVTPPETETETETEKKEHCADAKAPRTKQEYSDEFETKFWLPYPRSPTMAKKEAWREWMKLDLPFPRHGIPGYYALADLPQRAPLSESAKSTGWEELDKILKIYPGQFIVTTGNAGSGKSTFLFNLIINLCWKNKTKAWLYVPENEMNLMQKLQLMFGDKPEGRCSARLRTRNVLSSPRIMFTTTTSRATSNGYLATHGRYEKDGVSLVLIDPWNELERARLKDENLTDYIGRCLMRVKMFAKETGCTMFMVAHPTKAANGRDVTLGDIEGSMHWFNKCDNGLIVKHEPGSRKPCDQRQGARAAVRRQARATAFFWSIRKPECSPSNSAEGRRYDQPSPARPPNERPAAADRPRQGRPRDGAAEAGPEPGPDRRAPGHERAGSVEHAAAGQDARRARRQARRGGEVSRMGAHGPRHNRTSDTHGQDLPATENDGGL
jgi:energy-coupling factor transporter ATP-binding protein EcfA2